MKPNTGMMDTAIERYRDIDLNKSIFIGDSECDRELASRMRIDFYGIISNDEREGFKYKSILEVSSDVREAIGS